MNLLINIYPTKSITALKKDFCRHRKLASKCVAFANNWRNKKYDVSDDDRKYFVARNFKRAADHNHAANLYHKELLKRGA